MTKYFYLPLLWLAAFSSAVAQSNYVISRSYKVPTTTVSSGGVFWGAPDQVSSSVHYFDQLGKSKQEVSVYGSNTPSKDVIVQKEYNTRHQLVKTTLPATNGSGNSGGYAGSLNLGFYQDGNRVTSAVGDQNLASQRINYDGSPLGRPQETFPASVSSNGVRLKYRVNSGDNVKRYTLSSLPGTNGYYADGELTYAETKDESDKTVREFKDFKGLTVLRRVIVSGGSLDTYYVYDEKEQLRYVLQPEYDGNADLNQFAFKYTYDRNGNVTGKKVPGANDVSMTYDGRNRMSTMTDGRGQVFSYQYEDGLNRLTGTQLSGQDILKYYYDSYPDRRSLNHDYSVFPEWGNQGAYFLAADPFGASRQGLQTAIDARVIKEDGSLDAWLLTLNVYDNRYQIVQVIRQLYGLGNGAYERVSFLRDFAGKVIRERTDQYSGSSEYHLEKTFTYDHMDRLTKTVHKVWEGNNSGSAKTYTHNEITYNEIGTPSRKKLHGGIHEVAIKSHVRGWMGSVNNVSGKTFSIGLNYANNGNVTGINWSTNGYSGGMSVGYDDANRMTSTSGSGSFNGYTESVEYRKNGNISRLYRSWAGGQIDNLEYFYNGNQAHKVKDYTGNGNGFSDSRDEDNEITYDGNGNQTEDKNRKFRFEYNAMNLIRKVFVDGNEKLRYAYDAAGVKRKLDAAGSNTFYAGTFEYSGEGNLKRISLEDGQLIRNSSNNFTVQYYLRDHLGNVRMVIDENNNVVQETEYYAFGMTVDRTTNSNRYLYNEKEKQPETGFFDYGARQYDPVLGRWTAVDPMAEKFESLTPFNYAVNSPLVFIDPDGMEVTETDQSYVFTGEDAMSAFAALRNNDPPGKRKRPSFAEYMQNRPVMDYQTGGQFQAELDQNDYTNGYINKTEYQERVNERGIIAVSAMVGEAVGAAAGVVIGRIIMAFAAKRGTAVAVETAIEATAESVTVGSSSISRSIPTLEEQAAQLVQMNGGRNSVTLRTSKLQTRFDLAGRAHGGVPTPHSQVYIKNFVNGEVKSVTRASKHATGMTQSEIRMVRKYLQSLTR